MGLEGRKGEVGVVGEHAAQGRAFPPPAVALSAHLCPPKVAANRIADLARVKTPGGGASL
jgi:hypothetical protein